MIPISIPDLSTLPAFMGYKSSRRGGFMIRCCSWCEGKAEVQRIAQLRGMEVTHGACPKCAAVQIARITGAAI